MDNDQDQTSDGTVEEFLLAQEAAEKGGHPAWQEILNAVPEEYHEALRPTLEKWDSGVQKRFNSLHSQYAPLKDYAEVDPQVIAAGINLINRIEEDPKAVFDLMRETYQFDVGTTVEQGAKPMSELMGTGNFDEQDEYARQIAAQQQQLQELREQQQKLMEQAEAARMASELDAYLAHLHQEHGDFDNDYVVTLMANGVDGTEAVQRYNSLVENIRGPQAQQSPTAPPAPNVMGSGGGVPSRSVDPKSLSNGETKDLVAQLLEQANQTG